MSLIPTSMAQWSWTTRYALLGRSHISLPVPFSSCVVIVIAIVIVNGNYSLGSEGICPGSKGQQGLCTTDSHGTLFQSHGDVATDPCHGHLCHEALDTFGHPTSATLTFDVQPEEHFTSTASRNPSDSTSQASWDILDAVEMESSHQREITPDMSSGEITPEIYLMMGTTPLCLHQKGAQLAVSRSRNEKTCGFFAWTEHQPLIKRTDWVQSPLHNQGRNECLQDPKKMPSMPQNHL